MSLACLFGFSCNSTEAISRIDAAIDSSISATLQSAQTCNQEQHNTNVNIQSCSNCAVCSLDMHDLDVKMRNTMDQSCLADFSVDANMQQSIEQNFAQAAEAVNKDLNLGVNDALAEDITNLSMNLASALIVGLDQETNQYSQNLMMNAQYAVNCGVGDIRLYDVSFETVSRSIQNSVMTTSTVVEIRNQIETKISQTAMAKNEGLNLNMLLGGLIIFAVLFVIFAFAGKTVIKSLFTTIPGLLITLVVIWLVIAGIMGYFPFARDEPDAPTDDAQDDPQDDTSTDNERTLTPTGLIKFPTLKPPTPPKLPF